MQSRLSVEGLSGHRRTAPPTPTKSTGVQNINIMDAATDSSKRPKLGGSSNNNKANVLMVGTGEYTTGYVGGTAADSDKGSGVVALTMFDLRRREKVDRVGMCGVNVSE